MNAAWSTIKTVVGAVVDWLRVTVPAVFEWIKNAFLTYTAGVGYFALGVDPGVYFLGRSG